MRLSIISAKVKNDRNAIIQLLKYCGKKKDISTIRRICACMEWITKDIAIATTLIHSYAKCGAVKESREVFDQLAVRDTVCWNALIAGYVDQGLSKEALICFREMERDRVTPVRVTYICTLKACAVVGAVEIVEEIHARLTDQQLLSKDIVLGSTLVHAYAKCGALEQAREVFDNLVEPNVVCWNVLITGYADQGFGKEALACFKQMQRERVAPDYVTYTCTLKACAIVGALDFVYEIHAKIRDHRLLHEDIVLGSTLVHAYAKCGAVNEAREVFDKLVEPNVVSWNALISGYADQGFGEEALICFREMKRHNVTPDSVTYACALKASAIVGAVDIVDEIHAQVRNQGLLCNDIVLGNTLVDAYAKCGDMNQAQEVFDMLAEPNVVSWNSLLTGYVDHGFGEEALTCFRGMQRKKVTPDSVTYICALKACVFVGALDTVDQIYTQVRDGLLNKDIILGSTFVDAYAKCGAMKEAQDVFSKLKNPNVVSWNALIAGYVDKGFAEEALTWFREMQRNGMKPDIVTYICTLKACAIIGALQIVEEINARVQNEALLNNDYVLGSMLVDAYAKCGAVKEAHQIFDKLTEPDVVSWGALMAGYAKIGHVVGMLELFNRMMVRGTVPDPVIFTVLINGCSHGALLAEGQVLFHMIGAHGFVLTPEHYASMADLFGRAGCFEKAKLFVFDHTSTLLAFLGACQKWANIDHGRWAFKKLLKVDGICSSVYVCMSNMYAAAGMMKEADEIAFLRVKDNNWEHTTCSDASGNPHIYTKLAELRDTLMNQGHKPDFHLVVRSISDHEKILCSYMEKLAIHYALISTS